MRIFSGKLDSRIRLQRPVIALNAFGEQVTSYVDVQTVWASVDAKSPAEEENFEQSSQQTAKQKTEFVIRYRENVGPKWLIVYGGRVYEIFDVAEINRREGLLLSAYARDVVPGGS